MKAEKGRYELGIEDVQNFLPQRAPFLLVDKILDILPVGDLTNSKSDSSKVGIKVFGKKNYTINEYFFSGHFPKHPIVPGVLLLETFGQVASFSLYPYIENQVGEFVRNFECILLGCDAVRFRKPVVPGDTLMVETEVMRCRSFVWSFKCQGSVDGQVAVEAELLAKMGTKGENS